MMTNDGENIKITVKEYTIPVGAKKEFSVYHMSDNHICLADERDDERKRRLAAGRVSAFSDISGEHIQKIYEAMLEEVRTQNIPLVHTGDLIDFVSKANLEYAKKTLEGMDVIMAVGNHEFSQYVGEAFEDEGYKAQSKEEVLAAMPEGSWFGVRVIEGVKFITLDNVYYYVTPWQSEQFKKELSDGMPAVLVVHTPLYSKDMYEQVIEATGIDTPPYLMGCPEPLLRHLDGHRFRQQVPDGTTIDFLEFCEQAPNLRAILSGHFHRSYVSKLDSGIPQYVVDGGFHAVMNKYTFV